MLQLGRDLWHTARYLWACRRLDKLTGEEEDVLLAQLDGLWCAGTERSIRFIHRALELRKVRRLFRMGYDS